MIYNTRLNKTQTEIDCLTCPYFNKQTKKCEGLGKICFEQTVMGNLLDPITRMPMKKKEIRK